MRRQVRPERGVHRRLRCGPTRDAAAAVALKVAVFRVHFGRNDTSPAQPLWNASTVTKVYCLGCGNPLTVELRRAVTQPDVSGRRGELRRSRFYVDPYPLTAMGKVERELDPSDSIVVHPDDRLTGSLTDVPEHSYGCCGLDGLDGPNQACATCGRTVGTARTDCWIDHHEMRFWPADAALR
jgi:hypothetical protein